MSKVTRTFTPDELDELEVAFDGECVVQTRQTSSGRWETHHIAIFRAEDDGLLWQVGYQLPATERQECDRWYDENPVTATQVEPYQVEVTKYRPVTAVPATA